MNQRRFQVFTRPPKGSEVQKALVTHFALPTPTPPSARHADTDIPSQLSL